MAEQNKKLLSRLAYRRIKGMDRTDLSEYVTKVYMNGYEAGRKAATPDILLRTFREVLLSIDSIGPTRADAIMKKLGDTFALKEKDDDPTETEESTEEVQEDGNEQECSAD